jgi:hypothetical protein
MKPSYLIILLFQFIPFSQSYSQEFQDPISNSILSFIDQVAPWFETRYVSHDGKDLKYTDFLISGIKSASADQQQIKALTSFAMVIASLSKEDAKIYGAKIGKDEEIRKEYQSYLYLGTIPISSEEEKLQVYLHAIKSIAFHLKVKEIPVYEKLEMVNDYVENELSKNLQTLPKNDALRINQVQLHFLLSIALENFSRFLSLGILEEGQNPKFDQLATSRSKILPQVKNVGELSESLIQMEGEAYLNLNKDVEALIGKYFDLTANLMGKIINE